MKTLFFLGAALALGVSCQTKAPQEMDLKEAVSNNKRTEAFTQRDQYRHPVETLTFFGMKPDMTVIEISPGAGWYTEIIAPYLAARGEYIMATNKPTKEYQIKNAKAIESWLKANPAVKAKIVDFAPPSQISLGEDNSADMVVTFRNVHNWVGQGAAQKVFKAFYNVLKAGGTLGVVEHRMPENSKDTSGKSGYIKESVVIKIAKEAGFKLEEKSEINANPKDTTVHPHGVWTLPPSLRLGEKNRDHYLKIGESDRMTLRFVKPLK